MDELFPFVVLAAAIVGVPALLAWALARQRRSLREWAETARDLGLTFQPPGWLAGREPLQRIRGRLEGVEVEAVVRDQIGGRLRPVEVTARSGHTRAPVEVHIVGPKGQPSILVSSEGAAAPSDGPAALRRLLGPELDASLQELFGGHDLALVVEPGLARLRWTMLAFGREDPARLGRALRLAAALAKRLEAPSAGA